MLSRRMEVSMLHTPLALRDCCPYAFLQACSHVFHTKCCDNWLWRHQKCPMCRTPLAAVPAS